jgi:hypothetical protein
LVVRLVFPLAVAVVLAGCQAAEAPRNAPTQAGSAATASADLPEQATEPIPLAADVLDSIRSHQGLGDVERDYDALQKLDFGPSGAAASSRSVAWWVAHYRDFTKTAYCFVRKYPSDPRSVQAVMMLTMRPPYFVASIKGDVARLRFDAVVMDATARSDWQMTLIAALDDVFARQSVPVEAWNQAFGYLVEFRGVLLSQGRYRAPLTVLLRMKGCLDEGEQRGVQPGILARGYRAYYDALKEFAPPEHEALLARLVHHRVVQVSQMAQGILFAADAVHHPIEFRLTAMDGRTIDLGAKRGRIVVIGYLLLSHPEYWKCLTALEQSYGRAGVEVVGIEVDAEYARTKVAEFIATEKITWPTCFDGKAWNGDSVSKFDVRKGTFLIIGRNGTLVARETEPTSLEAALKKILAN